MLVRGSVDPQLCQWQDYLNDKATAHMFVKRKKEKRKAGKAGESSATTAAAVAKVFLSAQQEFCFGEVVERSGLSHQTVARYLQRLVRDGLK